MFVCIPPEKAIPEMIYTVSGGTLNPTHSLTSEVDGTVIAKDHPSCLPSLS